MYDSQTLTFSYPLTQEQADAMAVTCPDRQTGVDEETKEPIYESGIDRELTQACDGAINPSVQKRNAKALAEAKDAVWDAMTDKQKQDVIDVNKPTPQPIKPIKRLG